MGTPLNSLGVADLQAHQADPALTRRHCKRIGLYTLHRVRIRDGIGLGSGLGLKVGRFLSPQAR